VGIWALCQRDGWHSDKAENARIKVIWLYSSICGSKGRGKTRFVEKSKSGTFPLRSEIPQGRRDSQFFHRPDRDDFIFSDFTPKQE
jgi:hypothetical protein